jgi:hypothetical protein
LYEKVFDVPVEEHGITYMGIDVPEMEPTGPAAFVVASDGSFYIADTVGGRVLHYSPKGDRLSIITPSEQVVGIADLAVIDSDVVVLDVAAMVPRQPSEVGSRGPDSTRALSMTGCCVASPWRTCNWTKCG